MTVIAGFLWAIAIVAIVALITYDHRWTESTCPLCGSVFVGPRGRLPFWYVGHDCTERTPS